MVNNSTNINELQGWIQGGGGGRTRRASPLIFHTKYQKNVRASLRSAQFF